MKTTRSKTLIEHYIQVGVVVVVVVGVVVVVVVGVVVVVEVAPPPES